MNLKINYQKNLTLKMYSIYTLENDSNLMNSVRKFDWRRNLPGGWLNYGPPRKVTGYGDGQKIKDDGTKYGDKWNYTAWSASVPFTNMTTVTKTESIPDHFLETGILQAVRECLRNYGAEVNDTSGTGLWCNYYDEFTDNISGHKDNEDYYERNYETEPLFVSLTLFEDEVEGSYDTARFQIKVDGKWQEIPLPHMSLLVMSGDIEHRVMKPKIGHFRKRYNITFRSPVSREEDAIKNYRFFSNFGRYYRPCYALYVPDIVFMDKLPEKGNLLEYIRDDDIAIENDVIYPIINDRTNYTKCLKRHSEFSNIYIIRNMNLNRIELMSAIRVKYSPSKNPPATTTNHALYVMLYNEIL